MSEAVIEQWVEGDEDFDMANLPSSMTGIVGTVYVSTKQGSHGPRVKYYRGRPGGNDYCVLTISSTPRLLHSPFSIEPRVLEQLKQWVTKNHQALESFWWDGLSWTWQEVQTVLDSLQKV